MVFIVGSVIIGGLGLAGGVIASNNSKKATQQATQAATQANTENNALAREIQGRNEGYLRPFIDRGQPAGTAINALLGLGGDQAAQERAFEGFRGSTGYQFQQDQARRGVTGSFAARGLGQSGAALRALSDRSQGIADSSFGSYVAALQGQQGTGAGAASALAGVGQNFVGQVSSNNNALADTRGNAALAGAANNNALLGQFGQAAGYALGNGAFGSSYGRPSANNYSGGNILNWADSLPGRNTPIGLYG